MEKVEGMVRQFKSSQFNEYLGNLDDSWVISNNLSGGMIEVEQNIYEALFNNEISRISEKELIEGLAYGNFIVDNSFNEVDGLKATRNEWVESALAVGLQIIPTLSCNFDCPYCYENQREKKVFMSQQVMDDILNYLSITIKPTTKCLNVSWYGGEPLLAVKQIEYLSDAFLKLSREKNIDYRATIITNGFLLNKSNVDKLVKFNVKIIQVTIDGPKRIHDKRRMLSGGKETWQTIVDNIKYALSLNLNVTVRVNIDKSNIDNISELFEELEMENVLSRVSLSFGIVLSFGNVCKSVEETILTLEDAEKKISQEKIQEMLGKTRGHSRRFTPDFLGCTATAKNSIIVGPSGELYKCSKTIGSVDEICGDIAKPFKQNPNYQKWGGITNLNDESCKKCSVLPICCGGGCAFEYVIKGKDIISCDSKRFKKGYSESLKRLYLKNREFKNIKN